MNNTFKLIISIAISELAGVIGSIFTTPSISSWYAGLIKPKIAPPNWVFAPVWTTLFALMGIAAFLIWKKGLDRRDVKIALGIFIGQLFLNVFWSIIFFNLHSPGAAFIEIIILWLAILAAIITFAKISRPAAWLLLPYILWVSFAGYLNYSIWQLNASPKEIGNNWESVTDSRTGITFQYPETLSTKYITAFDWPPKVQILNEPFTCTEAGSRMTRAGRTEKRFVDGREYCVTEITEGAAGSIYAQYAYAFSKEGKTIIFNFTTREPQCANYEEPQRKECESEREAFDLDGVVDRMAQSVRF